MRRASVAVEWVGGLGAYRFSKSRDEMAGVILVWVVLFLLMGALLGMNMYMVRGPTLRPARQPACLKGRGGGESSRDRWQYSWHVYDDVVTTSRGPRAGAAAAAPPPGFVRAASPRRHPSRAGRGRRLGSVANRARTGGRRPPCRPAPLVSRGKICSFPRCAFPPRTRCSMRSFCAPPQGPTTAPLTEPAEFPSLRASAPSQVICLSDLQNDFINPHDSSSRINKLARTRGLHSSTFQLNLSPFQHGIHPIHPLIPPNT